MTEQEWRKEFARAVRVRMRRKNMTQKELAEEADISEQNMSKYMKCYRTPRPDKIIRIAKALECTTDELIVFDDDLD